MAVAHGRLPAPALPRWLMPEPLPALGNLRVYQWQVTALRRNARGGACGGLEAGAFATMCLQAANAPEYTYFF
jgi:hypothetical protein